MVPGRTDESKDDEEGSVDTNDALLDMLGLANSNCSAAVKNSVAAKEAPLTWVLAMDEEVDNELEEEEEERKNHTTRRTNIRINIPLPPKCSRYGHAPSQCAAVVVDHFWSPSECQALIEVARTSSQRGFQYITEASHTAPDGSTYKVQLQNPNPHKLAVWEDAPLLEKLVWQRLIQSQLLLLGEKNACTNHWLYPFQQRTQAGPPRGLNPRLRVLQYDASANDRFEPHFDATTHVLGQVSRITVLLYLNTGGGVDFEGGETRFLDAHISNYNNFNNNSNGAQSSQFTDSNHHHQQKQPDNFHAVTPQAGRLVMFEHDLYHSGAPLQWGTKHVLRTDILFDKNNVDTQGDTAANDNPKESTTAVGEEAPNNESTTNNTSMLVMDVCQSLGWTPDQQSILEDMGVLQGTCEALLVPGIGLLTALLVESGIPRSQVDLFLKRVQQHVQK